LQVAHETGREEEEASRAVGSAAGSELGAAGSAAPVEIVEERKEKEEEKEKKAVPEPKGAPKTKETRESPESPMAMTGIQPPPSGIKPRTVTEMP